MTLLKILVACHKPAVLPPEGFYIPIHAGRKGAENKLSADDWHWMLQNTRGDDTGDNISGLNPHLAEMSAVYWLEKLIPISATPNTSDCATTGDTLKSPKTS